MVRPFIWLKEDYEVGEKKEEADKLKSSIISKLSKYMQSYEPEKSGSTKSALMGPVGKLISSIASGKFDNEDAIIGFIVSIHNNTSVKKIEETDLRALREAVQELAELHKLIPRRFWLRTLREIDYGVFVHRYGQMFSKNTGGSA